MHTYTTHVTSYNYIDYWIHFILSWEFLSKYSTYLSCNSLALSAGRAFNRNHWSNLLAKDVLSLERTRACFELIEGDPVLGYDLAKSPSTLPGHFLKHCFGAVDRILQAQTPCIWKVGYTHCAHFRFHNSLYGYKNDREKWEKMVVIFAGSETIAPGYIEAAIIQRHKGILNAFKVYIALYEMVTML